MSNPLPSNLLDRALAPSTRLMARLRFSQKAMVIGAAFALTCAVLAGIVLVRANEEISQAQMQLTAEDGVAKLHSAMLAMQAHRQMVTRLAAKDGVAKRKETRQAANARAIMCEPVWLSRAPMMARHKAFHNDAPFTTRPAPRIMAVLWRTQPGMTRLIAWTR